MVFCRDTHGRIRHWEDYGSLEGTVFLEFFSFDIWSQNQKSMLQANPRGSNPPGSLGTDPLPFRSEGQRGLNLHHFHASPFLFSTTATTRQATPAHLTQHIPATTGSPRPRVKSDPVRPLESRATPLGRQCLGDPPLAAGSPRAGVGCRDRGPHRTVSRANLDSMFPIGHHSFLFSLRALSVIFLSQTFRRCAFFAQRGGKARRHHLLSSLSIPG